MEKDKPLSVMILAWLEILIGGIGSILFVLSLHAYLHCLYLIKTGIDTGAMVGADLGFLYSVMTFPSVPVLISGLGILNLKEWARKMDIIFVPLALILAVIILSQGALWEMRRGNYWAGISISVMFAPLFLIIFLKIRYLTRPRVKKQFE